MSSAPATNTTEETGFFDWLGSTIKDVGTAFANSYGSSIGSNSPALNETTTTTQATDTITIGGVTITPVGIIMTVGGVLGAVVLASFVLKALK